MIAKILFWIGAAVVCSWIYLRTRYSYFKNRGVKQLPTVPLFGNAYRTITNQEQQFTVLDKLYKAFPDERFVGYYEIVNQLLLMRDPELIKKIVVKDLDSFTDHRAFTTESDFLSISLFGMKGDKWRNMRSTLSPAFTASKLRNMVPLIQECAKSLENQMLKDIKNSKDGKIDVNCRDIISRCATDVIATCAFGLKTNSIAERNNEFYEMGKLLTNLSIVQFLKIFLIQSVPYLDKMRFMAVFSKKAINFFSGIFLGTMRNREQNNIHRTDMIQLLIEARKGTLTHEKDTGHDKDAGFSIVEESDVGKGLVKEVWDDQHIAAQGLLFFFAGFDTLSSAMVFFLHELALNPEIQKRLQREIDETLELHQGQLNYEQVNHMKYLDMCISESLRKWPPTGLTDRLCTQTYNLGKPNDKAPDFIVPKGMIVALPMYSIHRDEKYYPDPEKYDPERFSDENKHNITPFIYAPFGFGPRNCIGSRFALIEIKTLTIAILRNFDVSPSPTTKQTITLDRTAFTSKIEGDEVLSFTLRKKTI